MPRKQPDADPRTEYKHTIAVDWDGTCVPPSWPERPSEWMPGAVEELRRLTDNFYVIIWTSRIAPLDPWGNERTPAQVAEEVQYIRDMLDNVGLQAIDIFQHPWKPGAARYVDDKAMAYHGRPGSWRAIREKLEALFLDTPPDFPHLEELIKSGPK